MRLMIAAALCAALPAAQIAAAPAFAAELDSRSPFTENQRGAFAGVRLRAKLGGSDREMRASLALAPTSHNRHGSNSRMALGEGLELSFAGAGKPELRLAGQRMDQLSLLGEKRADKANLSPLATAAIVVGVVVIVGAVAFFHVASEASCFNGSTSFHGGGDGSDC